MAGRGPPPKDPEKRQRRNKAPDVEELPAVHAVTAPPLPNRSKYLAGTRHWYDTWASSPQAAGFGVTDWQRLHMLAALVDAYWREPSKELMGEIRLNESKLGATVEDRFRVRWRLPGSAPAAEDKPEPAREPSRRRPSRAGRDPRLRSV